MRWLLAVLAVYVLGYAAFRQTQVEVWAKDKRAYVIFPDSGLGRALYFGWRPLSYADGAITGRGAHIGPHR